MANLNQKLRETHFKLDISPIMFPFSPPVTGDNQKPDVLRTLHIDTLKNTGWKTEINR
jgi:hypothetical protein